MTLVTLKKRIYLLAVFSVGALTFLGCGRPQPRTAQQSEAQRNLEARFKQLELRISAAKMEWRRNEPIVVNVHLINNGSGHVIMTQSGAWLDYRISLVDATDLSVPIDMSMNKQLNRGVLSARDLTIKPGETIEYRIPISEHFEMNRRGIYKVTVRRQVGIRRIVEYELISNTITISVVE